MKYLVLSVVVANLISANIALADCKNIQNRDERLSCETKLGRSKALKIFSVDCNKLPTAAQRRGCNMDRSITVGIGTGLAGTGGALGAHLIAERKISKVEKILNSKQDEIKTATETLTRNLQEPTKGDISHRIETLKERASRMNIHAMSQLNGADQGRIQATLDEAIHQEYKRLVLLQQLAINGDGAYGKRTMEDASVVVQKERELEALTKELKSTKRYQATELIAGKGSFVVATLALAKFGWDLANFSVAYFDQGGRSLNEKLSRRISNALKKDAPRATTSDSSQLQATLGAPAPVKANSAH